MKRRGKRRLRECEDETRGGDEEAGRWQGVGGGGKER